MQLPTAEGPAIPRIPEFLCVYLQTRSGSCRFSEYQTRGRSLWDNGGWREKLQASQHCVRSAPGRAPYLSRPHQNLPLHSSSWPLPSGLGSSTSSIRGGDCKLMSSIWNSPDAAMHAVCKTSASPTSRDSVLNSQNSDSFHDPCQGYSEFPLSSFPPISALLHPWPYQQRCYEVTSLSPLDPTPNPRTRIRCLEGPPIRPAVFRTKKRRMLLILQVYI